MVHLLVAIGWINNNKFYVTEYNCLQVWNAIYGLAMDKTTTGYMVAHQ